MWWLVNLGNHSGQNGDPVCLFFIFWCRALEISNRLYWSFLTVYKHLSGCPNNEVIGTKTWKGLVYENGVDSRRPGN